MDRAIFFSEIRADLFGGRMNGKQVAGCEAVLDAWDHLGAALGWALAVLLAIWLATRSATASESTLSGCPVQRAFM